MAKSTQAASQALAERVRHLAHGGPPASLPAMLIEAAAVAPQQLALVDGDRQLTYADYLATAQAFASHLVERSAAGQRIVTVLGNAADTCIAYFGIWMAGAHLVPLNPLYTADELAKILGDSAPALIIVDESFADTLAALRAVRELPPVELVGDIIARAAPAEAPLLPVIDPSDLAMVQYTGGTSGIPKGVRLTHASVAFNVWQREMLIPMEPGERVLCVMPLFHSYAMAMGLFLACYSQSTLVTMARYRPDVLLRTLSTERITIFPGNPTIYTGLLGHSDFDFTDWSQLRICFSGSAALPGSIVAEWQERTHARILEGYGQTESGPVLTYTSMEQPSPPGSVGRPLINTDIRIVDLETGTREMGVGELGEVIARGPQIMAGYRNKPEQTALALRDGWLFTGDIGELDAAGNLYIRDRKTEMVISGGYNVYPREIEEVLVSHPEVVDVAVIGVPDAYRGEVLRAHVVTSAHVSEEELAEYCRARLARYKVPAQFRFLDRMPKTAVNKTDKKALKQEASS